MAKSAKKKAGKAQKAKAAKKKAKTAARKTTKKAAKKATKKRTAALGCCTLTGSGPDLQFEGITKAECRRRAIAMGKNDHWVRGKCAQPD